MVLHPIAFAAALLATLAAAATDARTGRIPNWLTLPLIALAPLLHGWLDGAEGIVRSLLGVVCCAMVPVLLFARGAMGGGDVKLFAALGGLLGPYHGVEVQFFAYFALSLLLLARMAWEGRLLATVRNVVYAAGNLVLPARLRKPLEPTLLTSMRMGLAIFCATLASYLLNAPAGLP